MHEAITRIPSTPIDKLDLLFALDSAGLGASVSAQGKLRSQFSRLIRVLSSGDRDGNGTIDFPAVKSLHLGVVTSDMGLPGVQGVSRCAGLGQDGILQNKPSASMAGCLASYPAFLDFSAGTGNPDQTAADLSCVASVGTSGCGFEHSLEAPLKALWPSVDPMALNGVNRIKFLPDPATGAGQLGHGDVESAGFLRNDPQQGLSLIAIVVVSDHDDCSARDTHPFTPPQFLDPADPLAMQNMSVRCHYNQAALYPIERYINGFKALRPGNENMVLFAAIAGVPTDLVNENVLQVTNFQQPDQRYQFYQHILADQRMQDVVNAAGTPDPSDDRPQASCIDANGAMAWPPIRLVQVAQGIGENSMVQSICSDDYGPALDVIVGKIVRQLGERCLQRPLVRAASGTIGCNVLWELPPPGTQPSGTPTACGGALPWLLALDPGEPQTTKLGGQICRVAQLAVEPDANSPDKFSPVPTLLRGQTFSDGWYYDDFSADRLHSCSATSGTQRIAFTPNATPPPGVGIVLDCVAGDGGAPQCADDVVASCNVAPFGQACLPMAIPDGGFSDQESYVQTGNPECGGGLCLVYHLRGDPRATCVPSPSANICSDRTELPKRLYCSCRCDAHGTSDDTCTCPDGFSCVDVLYHAAPGVNGSYCVKDGTVVAQ